MQLLGRFLILFLSSSVPGGQLWFYPHFCLGVIHRSLLLRLPWRTWVCLSEDSTQLHGDRNPSDTTWAGKPTAMVTRDMALLRVFCGLPWCKESLDSKESTCSAGDPGLIPGLGRSRGEGHGNPLQHSCPENPHGKGSLVGYRPWSCKESDTTEWLNTRQPQHRSLL